MKTNKPKLDIFEFGKQLVMTMDLDPVYVVLYHAALPEKKLHSWLLAYFCFYHVGTASWISDQKSYWDALEAAAATKEHPRSSERRHFRGQQAIKAVEELRERGQTPTEIMREIGNKQGSPLLSEVTEKVKNLRGFGDWIAFKVADIIERLDMCAVQFAPEDVFEMYDSPRKGAEAMAEMLGYQGDSPYTWAYDTLLAKIGYLSAPPRNERTLNIQEIETILCKWKSHLNGHYEVGKDVAEVRHGLLKYARCRTSQNLIAGGKKGGLW